MADPMRTITIVAIALLMLASAASADYSGSLSSPVGIDGEQFWIDPGVTNFSWAVAWVESESAWRYSYTLNVPQYQISHMIIEVSDDFALDDIWGIEGLHTEFSLGTHDSTNGNPNMPGQVYGIRVGDYVWGGENGLTATLDFYSSRTPVWADFYAKCGGGAAQNEAWNMGLTAFEDDDPLAKPSDGSLDYHILAPNGEGGPETIPEPATTALFITGLAGLFGARLRRRSG